MDKWWVNVDQDGFIDVLGGESFGELELVAEVKDRDKANLIAAAPELLAALERFISHADSIGLEMNFSNHCKALIAKAKGEDNDG